MQKKPKPKYGTLSNTIWMIKRALETRPQVLVICLLIALTEVLLNLTQLYIAPEILEQVEQHSSIKGLLCTIAFFTAALFLTQGIKEYLTRYAMFPQIEVRTRVIQLVQKKSNTSSFPNTLNPDFIKLREKAHTVNDCNLSPTEYIWTVLTNLLQNTAGFIIYLTILSVLHPGLLVLVIVTCFGGFFVSRYTSNWMYQHRDAENDYYRKKTYIRGKAQSAVIAKDIRIFGLQSWMHDLLDSVHDAYLAFRLQMEKKWVLANVTEAVLTMARNGIAYFYLIHMALKGGLQVSEFVLYFTAVSSFTTWVMGILTALSRLHKDSLDISSLREFLDYPEPFRFSGGSPIPEQKPYELRLDRVSYRYPGAETDTIHNMNLTISPGEKLAIVGLNGAGKTTLVRLLCGLLDPTEGRVLLNGVDIREFDRREYYRLFSAVFQDFNLLDVTVAENVAQTIENIDREKVWDALEKAGLTKAIEALPKGLDTYVGREVFLDGVLFSGGQTQRLMLARALYKDGPILVLDEPTAALDPIAENDIYMKYNEMTQGKTAVFISHRLASTRFCDRIIFLSGGAILEEGTHDSLLSKNGEYAALFEVQSHYYREGRDF